MRALKSAMGPNLSKRVAGNSAVSRANAARARRKPDANIAGRLRFESFLLELSAYFAKAPADQVNKGIEEWLEKLARFIGVDGIGFWESSSDGVQMQRQHLYFRPGISRTTPCAQVAKLPWLVAQYRQGNIIRWARIPEDIPAAASAERAFAPQMNAKSLLVIPIRTSPVLYALSFANVRTYRKWPQSLVRRLHLVGEILASAHARQRAEQALRTSESSNRALLKALPDLIFVVDKEGVYIDYHCPETVDLYVPPSRFMGRTMEEVIPPEMAKTFRALFARAATTDEAVGHEYVMRIAGEERHFEARTVQRDDGATVTIVRNITERHRAANSLRDSEERFRAAFSHSAIGIALVSLEGHWLQVNPAMCRILGYSEAEMLSTTFQALTHPEDLAANRIKFERALAGEISHYEMDKRYIHKDGRTIWTLLTVALVRNAANEPLYFVSQLQDVTERRQAQIEIERARRELSHVGRVSLVGQLTTSLAHELLQPITAIVSNAETGLQAPDLEPSSEIRALFEDIAESGRRAADTIEHVRALLRKDRQPSVAVDLNRLVEEVAHVMHSDLVLHQVCLTTKLEAADAEIHGNRGELQQVLLNLVLNGTEAMHAIPIDERRLIIATNANSEAVELSVQDRGAGSPPGKLDQLMEPFFTTKSSGIGMGLSICADIVRAHRGQLLAENNPDRGMTWRCILPRNAGSGISLGEG